MGKTWVYFLAIHNAPNGKVSRILAESTTRVNANPPLWKKKGVKIGPAKRQATLTVFSTILNFHIHPPYTYITFGTSSGIYVIWYIHNSTTKSTNTWGSKSKKQTKYKDFIREREKWKKINTKVSSFRPRTQRERNNKDIAQREREREIEREREREIERKEERERKKEREREKREIFIRKDCKFELQFSRNFSICVVFTRCSIQSYQGIFFRSEFSAPKLSR